MKLLYFMDLGRSFWQSVEVTRETKKFYFAGIHTWEVKIPKETKPITISSLNGVPIYRTYYTESQKSLLEEKGIK